MSTKVHTMEEIPSPLEGMYYAFKNSCAPVCTAPATADMQPTQGATYYAVFPALIPRCESDLNGQEYSFVSPYMVQPIAPGRASAPYEYSRGSRRSREELFSYNKRGQPLSQWTDSTHTDIRFWGWEKRGFNRGDRIEDLTWTYTGGHVLSMCVNLKDIQTTDYDGSIPLFIEKKAPTEDMLQPFDLVKVSILPKNQEGLARDKKACFTLKQVGTTTRTLSGVLPHLRMTMPKSKEEAEQDTMDLYNGQGKYKGVLPYSHQVDIMPPKGKDGVPEIKTCAFLQEDVGPETTFMYGDDSTIIRMCIKPAGNGSPITVETTRHAFLRNANANDLHSACGFYTLAASCPGALSVYTTHSRFWGSMLWDEGCGYGEPTPFRGAPIVDSSKLMTSLSRPEFYLSNPEILGEGRKARVMVPLGFEVLSAGGGDADEDGAEEGEMLPAMAEVAIVPRRIAVDTHPSSHAISADMRLSIHGIVPMDSAYVMTVCMEKDGVRNNILNLDFNAARDLRGMPSVSGKKHSWSNAISSAIDDLDDEEDGDGGCSKRQRAVMDSVA